MALVSRRWFPLAESDDAFLKSAPFRYEQSVETMAPAERIWDVITGYDLVHWVPVWTGLRWGPPPLGVGTVREVTLGVVFTQGDIPAPRVGAALIHLATVTDDGAGNTTARDTGTLRAHPATSLYKQRFSFYP